MLDIRQLIYDKNNELMVYNKFDSVIENYENEFLNIYGEYYTNEVIIENMIYDATTINELEIVEESIKDNFIEFKNNAIKKLKELLKKFTDWIKRIKNSIKNFLFGKGNNTASSSKLKSMNKAELDKLLEEKYNEKKDTMRIEMYDFDTPFLDVIDIINDIEYSVNHIITNADYNSTYENMLNILYYKLSIKCNDDDLYKSQNRKQKIQEYITSLFRSDKKRAMLLNDMNISKLKEYPETYKELYNELDDFSKRAEKSINKIIQEISNTDDEPEKVKNISQLGTHALNLLTFITKAMVSEVKLAVQSLDKLVNKIIE